jgi:hypothetical protein
MINCSSTKASVVAGKGISQLLDCRELNDQRFPDESFEVAGVDLCFFAACRRVSELDAEEDWGVPFGCRRTLFCSES